MTTLRPHVNAVAGRFVDGLRAAIDGLVVAEKKFDTIESAYHIEAHDKEDELAKTLLHTLTPAACKLLTDRTLNQIYSEVLDAYMVDAVELKHHVFAAGLADWFRYCIYSHPDVAGFMLPIAKTQADFTADQIKRLDAVPYVEQKSQEWLRIRADMISASVAGYIDSAACGCGLSKETSQIREKVGLYKSNISWGVAAVRHGMIFEDVTGALYNLLNGVTSKEYGILPDDRHSCIGASPDGIIIGVDNDADWLKLRRMGRMREIKNPVEREINTRVPSYYYWQMIQQMYVCRLPVCDFIQTSFTYPNQCDVKTFLADAVDRELWDSVYTWEDLTRRVGLMPYVLSKLDWSKLPRDVLLDMPVINLNRALTRYVIEHWNEVSRVPLENINNRGQVKGVHWCFTKPDGLGGTDFEILFMDPAVPIVSAEQVAQFYATHSEPVLTRGFKLESNYFWSCATYLDYEVEYNQVLYEQGVLGRLLEKWAFIERLRRIPDKEEREAEFRKVYPARGAAENKKKEIAKSPYKRRAVSSSKVEYDLS